MTKDDAIEKLNSGADLIQLYTGFIYKGPGLIRDINKAKITNPQNGLRFSKGWNNGLNIGSNSAIIPLSSCSFINLLFQSSIVFTLKTF